MGGIGIGHRGTYDLGCFLEQPDVRFVAVADVKAARREAVKKMVDAKYGNRDCATYRDLRELLARQDIDAVLIATGPNWHATAAMLAANAGKDVYCEKPCTKNIAQSLILAETFRRTGRVFQAGTQRRNLPHFAFAVELARRGKLGKLQTVYAHPAGMGTAMSGWAAARAGAAQGGGRLGPVSGAGGLAAVQPRAARRIQFREGRRAGRRRVPGMGLPLRRPLPMGGRRRRHRPGRVQPARKRPGRARYASGVKLVLRNDGWLPLGSCPVRFEGETGWVETGDSGKLILSSPALLAGRKVAEIGGYPATFHVRDFLDCVKSRGSPLCNADVACHSHIACHAANIALFLDRQLTFDPRHSRVHRRRGSQPAAVRSPARAVAAVTGRAEG